jgi:hypothetical protein
MTIFREALDEASPYMVAAWATGAQPELGNRAPADWIVSGGRNGPVAIAERRRVVRRRRRQKLRRGPSGRSGSDDRRRRLIVRNTDGSVASIRRRPAARH